MGAPLRIDRFRNIKTPDARFSPDRILTNGGNSSITAAITERYRD